MFFLSCGALSRPFSLVFVKTLPKEERPSRKRKKEEYHKKRRERSDEIVKGRSSIYRKILGYYSTIFIYHSTLILLFHLPIPLHLPILLHLPLSTYTYPYYYIYPYTYPYYYIYPYTYHTILLHLPIHLPILPILLLPIHLPILLLQLPFTITLFNNYHYLITTLHNTINSLKKLIE
jgi:hypothetical protein